MRQFYFYRGNGICYAGIVAASGIRLQHYKPTGGKVLKPPSKKTPKTGEKN